MKCEWIIESNRSGWEPGVVQVDMVRLPASQELGAKNFADDRTRMGQPTQLDVAFAEQFESPPTRHHCICPTVRYKKLAKIQRRSGDVLLPLDNRTYR